MNNERASHSLFIGKYAILATDRSKTLLKAKLDGICLSRSTVQLNSLRA